MADGKTKRRDPRTEATRVALIEAAEALFAEFGFKAVSLRQIGAAIGSNNNTVVAYHFGTKEALIEAIYLYRLPSIDDRRKELMEAAQGGNRQRDLGGLLEVIWLPLFEQVDGNGFHSYGRFLGVMMREGLSNSRMLVNDQFETSSALWEQIASQLNLKPSADFYEGMHLTSAMVLEALNFIDRRDSPKAGGKSDRQIFEDALAMARVALLEMAHRQA